MHRHLEEWEENEETTIAATCGYSFRNQPFRNNVNKKVEIPTTT